MILSDETDGALATRAAAGDDSAFAALMRRHRGSVYRLILNNVADPDEALDLVQETFLSAHRALSRYDPARPMAAWLATIALNKCRDWGRRRALRRWLRFARPVDEIAGTVAADMPGQDTTAADRQELARLRAAIAALPVALREPLVLHAVEGMSHADTARILSITPKAVETRLRRARIKLNDLLGR